MGTIVSRTVPSLRVFGISPVRFFCHSLEGSITGFPLHKLTAALISLLPVSVLVLKLGTRRHRTFSIVVAGIFSHFILLWTYREHTLSRRSLKGTSFTFRTTRDLMLLAWCAFDCYAKFQGNLFESCINSRRLIGYIKRAFVFNSGIWRALVPIKK